MRKRSMLVGILGALFVLSLAWIEPSARAAPPSSDAPPSVAAEKLGWQLTGARVVNKGEILRIPEGTLTNGYTIEATANPMGDPGSIKGRFRLSLSVFTPDQEMPGQKVGYWYVNGVWVITDVNVAVPNKVRHSPDMLSGRLRAELTFDPTARAGMVTAAVFLPRISGAGQRTAGKGTFSGNERFEGKIALGQ